MRPLIFSRQGLLAAALVSLAFAAGLAASSYGSKDAPSAASSVTPVAYTLSHTPTVTPEQAQRAINSARDLSVAFRAASESVLPSVVTIETRPKVAANTAERRGDRNRGGERSSPKDPENSLNGRNPFEGTPFEDMFRDMPFGKDFRFEMPPMQPGPSEGGLGSGVIYDAAGLILTNNHVVSGGDVTVRLSDGREFAASNIWTDPKTDLAVVKIDGAEGLQPARFGDSEQMFIGDWVLALGQPFGLESTVTAGIISAKHRGIGIADRENFLQTDAAINPGNSGGPLVNLNGEVIGINTAISSRSGGNDGVGFAIPIELAKWVAQQLANGGIVRRAYLGVGIQGVNQQLANQFHVKPREGVVVSEVFPNTPAAKTGLQAGDVIVEFAGQPIASPQELQSAVEQAPIGQLQQVVVVRDGARQTLQFKPEEQPRDYGVANRSVNDSPGSLESSKLDRLGLEIAPLDERVAEQLGMKGAAGIVITHVTADSPAARAGLSSGQVITQVNRQDVTSVADAKKAMEQTADQSLLLLVRSSEGSRFVVLQPASE